MSRGNTFQNVYASNINQDLVIILFFIIKFSIYETVFFIINVHTSPQISKWSKGQ